MSIFKTATSKDENSLSGLRIATGSTLKKEAIEETNRALAEQAKHLAEDVEYMKQYTADLIDGKSTTDNFNKTLGKASKSAQDQAEALRNGTMSAKVYEQQQNAAVVATKGLSVASKAAAIGVKVLSAAMSMGVMLLVSIAIEAVVKGIDHLIHANEKAIEAGKEATENIQAINDKLKENSTYLKENTDSYAKLAQGVGKFNENLKLSDEDYAKFLEQNKQLAEIFPELVIGFDSNGNAILDLNGSVQEITDSLNKYLEVAKQTANQKIIDEFGDTLKGNTAQVKEYQKELKKLQKEKENLTNTASYKGIDIPLSMHEDAEGNTEYYKETAFKSQAEALKLVNDLKSIGIEAVLEDAFQPSEGSVEMLYPVKFELDETLLEYSIDNASQTIEAEMAALEEKIRNQRLVLSPSIQAYLDTSVIYGQFGEEAQSAISSVMNSLDFTGKSEEKAKGMIDEVVNTFNNDTMIAPAMSKLFALDTSKMDYGDWKTSSQELLNTIADSLGLEGDERRTFFINLGFNFDNTDKMLISLSEKLEKISSEQLNSLSSDEIKIAYGLENIGEMTFDELIAKIAETANQTGVLTHSFSVLSSQLSTLSNSSTGDFGNALYERLDTLKTQFADGKLSIQDYFDALNTEIDDVDFSNYTDNLEEAQQLQASFFASMVQESSQGLSNLMGSFDAGKVSISEYLDGFTSIAGTVSSLTDMLQTNSEAWTENGVAASANLDGVQSTLENAIATVDGYKDSIYSMGQILTGTAKQGSDEFTAHTQVIAADLVNIINTSGVMADQVKSRLGSTTNEIAENLTKSVANQQLAAQAIAGNTNAAIGNMASSVGTLFETLGNAISNFKVELSFGISNISWDKVNVLGAELPVPKIDFALEATGSTKTALQGIGAAVSNFGNSLQDNINSAKIELKDFMHVASDGYNPSSAAVDNYTSAIDNLANSAGDAKQAMQSMQSAQSAIQSLLKMTMDMINQQYDNEKKAIEKLKDAEKDRYDTNKKALEKAYEQEKKNHDLQKQAIEDAKDGEKAVLDLKLKALQAEKDAYYWNKELSKQNKSVADLQADIATIGNDDSDEGLAKKRELEAQLAAEKEKLADMQFDHSNQLQEDALNNEYNKFEEMQSGKLDLLEQESNLREEQHQAELDRMETEYNLYIDQQDEKLNAINEYTSLESNIRAEAIKMIENKNSGLYQKLLEWNQKYGDILDSTVINAWGNAYDALGQFNDGQLNVLDILNELALKMNDFEQSTKNAADAVQNLAQQSANVKPPNSGLADGDTQKSVRQEIQYWNKQMSFTDSEQEKKEIQKYINELKAKLANNTYHVGGVVTKNCRRIDESLGLKPDEQMVKAKIGETILSPDEPQNAKKLITDFINSNLNLNAFTGINENQQLIANAIPSSISGFAPSKYQQIAEDRSIQFTQGDIIIQGDASKQNVMDIKKITDDIINRLMLRINRGGVGNMKVL